MVMKIYPYIPGSKSAEKLADEMDIYRIKHSGSTYVPKPGDVVINWGKGRNFPPARTLNPPDVVQTCINKREFFAAVDETNVNIPDWCTSARTVRTWLNQGHKVLARTTVDGHEGEGIVILEGNANIPYAPLYVKYIPKDKEYRVYVVGDEVVDVVRKMRRNDAPTATSHTWMVRNTANGFVFCRTENGHTIHVPQAVKQQALLACHTIGLDFGGVDVIYTEEGVAYVLEINSAPALEGPTTRKMAEALKRIYG